jgi:hypothetical protein
MKVINPRGIEVEVPDEWKGNKLNDLLAKGFTLVEERVELKPIETGSIKVAQELTDSKKKEYEEEEIVSETVEIGEIPESRLRVRGKNNVMQRLSGHGKASAVRQRKAKKNG